MFSEIFCSNLISFSKILSCISTWGKFLSKDSCSVNYVLINFVFRSETLLQNFAVNNVLCMWIPVLYKQIQAIFCNDVKYSSPASSGKAVEFCCRQSLFFKKLQILLFWAGFSEDIWMYLSIYNWQKIILQENNLLMVNHVERVWVYWAVETDTVDKLNFGLPKYFLKDYSPFRGLLNWKKDCCGCCARYE